MGPPARHTGRVVSVNTQAVWRFILNYGSRSGPLSFLIFYRFNSNFKFSHVFFSNSFLYKFFWTLVESKEIRGIWYALKHSVVSTS